MAIIGQVSMRDRPLISDWIRECNAIGQTPSINSDSFPSLLTRRRISWREKADRLLLALLDATDHPGAQHDVREPRFAGTLQSYDPSVPIFLGRLITEEGWTTAGHANPQLLTVHPRGFIHGDELKAKIASSGQGFVAMWFSEELADAWSAGFHPGIRDAGYSPLRIDMKEHTDKICDEIIAEIRRSRFVVADFSGQRAGVYYEAGFAHGLGLPVIWTCRKSDMEGLHFDIRQYNCIDWEKPSELAKRLATRILAVLGAGPYPIANPS